MKFGKVIDVDGKGSYNPQLYDDTVTGVLRRIGRSTVGALVLMEVERPGRPVKIRPANGILDSASYTGLWPGVDKCLDAAKTRCYPKLLTGPGTPMKYLPGEWFPKKPGGRLVETDPYFRADEVLVHELVHRARILQDLAWFVSTNDSYKDREEFFAVTVTNVYLSEKGVDHRLRGGHSTLFERLSTTSDAFWLKYEPLIDILFKQMPTLTGFLTQVQCRFNPFRVHWEHQQAMKAGGCPTMIATCT